MTERVVEMNPLIQPRNNMTAGMQQPVNNPINDIMNVLQNGTSPQQLAQSIIQQNPQAAQKMNQVRMMSGQMSPKEIVLNYAQQQGIDTNSIMQLANQMGLR